MVLMPPDSILLRLASARGLFCLCLFPPPPVFFFFCFSDVLVGVSSPDEMMSETRPEWMPVWRLTRHEDVADCWASRHALTSLREDYVAPCAETTFLPALLSGDNFFRPSSSACWARGGTYVVDVAFSQNLAEGVRVGGGGRIPCC